MEQGREAILNKKQSDKMCSLCGNGAWKMCSPADTDTCGDGLFAVKKIKSSAKKWRISGIFVRLVSSEKPCGKLGFVIWKHIY